ncbi:Uncharacterised protein [Collinsella sp. AK_207A]|nr:Uncharacterised protein [Collinsella sp. AK_207A]
MCMTCATVHATHTRHEKRPPKTTVSGGLPKPSFPKATSGLALLPRFEPPCAAVNDCGWFFIIGVRLFPHDGSGSVVPSLQLHPVFAAVSSRVPPGNAMPRFVSFGDKDWDNSKYSFQTQVVDFLFLSQRARRAAFGGSIAPKTPFLKLNRPLARKPPAAIVSESTRAARAPFTKPQVAGLRHWQTKWVVSDGFPMS